MKGIILAGGSGTDFIRHMAGKPTLRKNIIAGDTGFDCIKQGQYDCRGNWIRQHKKTLSQVYDEHSYL